MSVQSQDILGKLVASFASEKSSVNKLALIVQSSLFKLQISRVAHGKNYKLFDQESDALAWLDLPVSGRIKA